MISVNSMFLRGKIATATCIENNPRQPATAAQSEFPDNRSAVQLQLRMPLVSARRSDLRSSGVPFLETRKTIRPALLSPSNATHLQSIETALNACSNEHIIAAALVDLLIIISRFRHAGISALPGHNGRAGAYCARHFPLPTTSFFPRDRTHLSDIISASPTSSSSPLK